MIEMLERQEFPLMVDGQECIATELYGSAEIDEAIKRMGAQQAHAYQEAGVDSIVLVPILQGGLDYAVDLRKAIIESAGPKVHMDGIRVSSTQGTESTGTLEFIRDVTCDIEGKHVLVADDIFDTGLTLMGIKDLLLPRRPASLRFTAMLDKPSERRVPGAAERIGGVASMFVMEKPFFVIGRGLDYEGDFRKMNYIARVRMPQEDGRLEP